MQYSADEIAEPTHIFSPSFIWDQFNQGNPSTGLCVFQAFDMLSTEGCCSLKDRPYDKSGRSKPDDTAKSDAIRHKSRSAVSLFTPGTIADPEKLKDVLYQTQEPFVLAITIYDDFFVVSRDRDFVYTPASDAKPLDGHAICVVGYDDKRHAFRVVNSWGQDWGDNGFLWISEDYVKRDAREGWSQMPGGPRARAVSGVENLINYHGLSVLEPGAHHLVAR
jgi:hypothetical protein